MKLGFTSALAFVVDAVLDVFFPGRPQLNSTSRKRPGKRREPRVSATDSATISWRKPDGELSALEIEITNTSSKGLGIRLPDEIPIGQTVTILAPENKKYRGVLRHCRPQDDGYFAGVVLVFRERRRNDREPLTGEGTLSWAGPTGTHNEEQVRVRNLSDEGMQLEVARAVPVPSMVRLSGVTEECFGSTCYCERDGDKYLVGLYLVGQTGTGPSRNVEAEMYGGQHR